MHERKNFIKINEGFKCLNCHKKVVALKNGGCRNHCPYCLYSLHVDLNIPGDRECNCHGLMKPIFIDQNTKKGFIIIHQCCNCRKEQRNKAAEDDDLISNFIAIH